MINKLILALLLLVSSCVSNNVADPSRDAKDPTGANLAMNPHRQMVILITGTASGIGKATAEYLIEKGHIVYGGDFQFEKNKYLDEIGGHSLDMDVTKPDMVEAGVAKILSEQGHIDILVNNAGFGQYGTIEEVSSEDAHYQMEVNLFGYVNLIKAVLPGMRERKSGRIINVSSMGGRVYTPFGGWYHASKYAVEGLSDNLRFELMEFGIDVVLIEPGYINTNFSKTVGAVSGKYFVSSKYPLLQAYLQRLTEGKIAAREEAEPQLVAQVIDNAINAQEPRTRYLFGPGAQFLVEYKAKNGDRAYDQYVLENMLGGSAGE